MFITVNQVWSTFSSGMTRQDKKPVIFVTSRFDGNALIRDLAYGASAKSGVVTLLAIMEALSKVR